MLDQNSTTKKTKVDPEIVAMSRIGEALGDIEDEQVVSRILKWAIDKFSPATQTITSTTGKQTQTGMPTPTQIGVKSNELPGIAKLSEDGKFELTVRDVKAKSQQNSALRHALIIIQAYTKLTGQQSVSSRRIVSPILKDRRLYNGNTRRILAEHQGIIRDRDNLSLDSVAKDEAESYIREALDPSVKGGWNPGKVARKKKAKQK